MPRVSRRRFLEAAGGVGSLALAGCSADADDEPTPSPTRTETATATEAPTPTGTPRTPADESLGFATMLDLTPAHPEMADDSYVWARYVDAAGLLGSVDDDAVGQRLQAGWLGSGPPNYTDSNAFELVHVQPATFANVTFGRGDFDADATVAGMIGDGWRRQEGDGEGVTRLGYGGYTAVIGERHWIVVSADDAELIRALAAAVEDDPLTDYLDDVDAAAMARATEERGNYLVVQRSVARDYAAGIALDYAPYRYPIGVLHYADGRASPSWQRVERRFQTQIAGELQAVDFGDDFQ